MWTNENRARYDRSGLRYPSDLTDAEWELVSPLIPPAKRGGGKRKVDMRQVVNGLMYVSRPAASGARSRRICRPGARFTAISIFGPMTARSIVSTMRFT